MLKSYRYFILLLLLILVVNIFADRPIQRVRLNSIDFYESGGLEPVWTDFQHRYYIYNSDSFYQLENVLVDGWSDPGGPGWFDYYENISCVTDVTDQDGLTQIDTIYEDNNYLSRRRTITKMDNQGRRISYQKYNNNDALVYNEEVFYSNYTQPDSIIINSQKWIYSYDNLGRKSSIDLYAYTDGWQYSGYYILTYLVPLSYQLYLYETDKLGDWDERVLFDATWMIDQIVFHPIQSEPDTLLWEVVNYYNNCISFSKTVLSGGSGIVLEDVIISFGSNGRVYRIERECEYNIFYSIRNTYIWAISVPNEDEYLPDISVKLEQNYPNPFTSSTCIKFSLDNPGQTNLKIFNVKGQLVRTLVNEYKTAGEYSQTWSGNNDKAESLPSGIYFLRLQSGNETKTSKLVYLK